MFSQAPLTLGTADLAIRARGLGKIYGLRAALAAVDLDVRIGESVAILGPNGAGKTTLLRLAAQLARPTSGTLRVAGLDVATQQAEARRAVGFLSHHSLLYDDLTAGQNLVFYGRLYGVPDLRRRIQELLVRVGLEGHREDLVRGLSQGMRQRLAVARALLPGPMLLLLDAPFGGLDGDACRALEELFQQEVERGSTVLLATHDLARVPALCRRAVVLNRGRLCGDVSIAGLQPAELRQVYEELLDRWSRPTATHSGERPSQAAGRPGSP